MAHAYVIKFVPVKQECFLTSTNFPFKYSSAFFSALLLYLETWVFVQKFEKRQICLTKKMVLHKRDNIYAISGIYIRLNSKHYLIRITFPGNFWNVCFVFSCVLNSGRRNAPRADAPLGAVKNLGFTFKLIKHHMLYDLNGLSRELPLYSSFVLNDSERQR